MGHSVGATILSQLGGHRFATMTGARNFVTGETDLTFDLPVSITKKRGNKFRITLLPSDTYKLELMRFSSRTLTLTVLETNEDVYVESLRETFASMTGLYPTL